MHLINSFVRNPVKVAVGALLVSLFGLIAFTRMPMQLTPEVQRPTITIETSWPGASPQEVEQEITMEQEEQLKSAEGVIKMTSESADSRGTITLEFRVGTNMEEALLKVNSRLQQVREYPQDADEPVITTSNAADSPIAWFILSTRLPSDDEFDAFEAKFPDLAEPLAAVRRAHNGGLAMLRLRNAAEVHPELRELLPPPELEVEKLRRFAEDEIEARFERVSGVSQSNVLGGLEDELQVIVDPEKLAARQLTLSNVRDVLVAQNTDVSAGDFWEGKRRWVVRAKGQFRTPEQVEDQLLSVIGGAPVFLRDVANVRLGFKKPDGLVRRFGESSIAVNCLRETGANVLDVMTGLKQTAAKINDEVLRPRRLQLLQVYDETEYIESSISLVQQNIFIGGALTMIVLMLFLHLGARTLLTVPLIAATAVAAAYVSPWLFAVCILIILIAGFWFARGALVVALAIPTSLIASFLVLGILGRSLNVISLAGLAFAVGMLVDNAVVVLENIYRRRAMGEESFTAAVRGTHEVWGAVAASTLTTVAVFLPVVFIQEEAGQLFRDIALAISAAVALSLLVSMTVIPTAAARLFRTGDDAKQIPRHPSLFNRIGCYFAASGNGASPRAKKFRERTRTSQRARESTGWIVRAMEWLGGIFVSLIVGINRWIQGGTIRKLVVIVSLIGLAVTTTWKLWPTVEYLPSGNRNLVFGILLPPPGYNLDQLASMGRTVEEELRPYWDIDPGDPRVDELAFPMIHDFFFVARGRQVFMGIRAQDPQRSGELVPLIQQVGMKMPGTFAVAKQASLFEQGLTAGRTIDIEITGPDLERLVALGGQSLAKVKQIMPTAQARPVPSLDLSTPEVHIQPKLVQAAEMNVSSRELGFNANALVDGAYVGDYYLEGKKVDITIMGESKFADTTHEIGALPIATANGQLIPMAAVSHITLASGPEQINHRERIRAITIEVSPPNEIALEDAMRQIRSEVVDPLVASGQLQGGYQITLAGTADKLSKMQSIFFGEWTGWNADSVLSILTSQFVLVVLITYLLMAALFESWLYPFVIILTVPLGAVGGIGGLNLLNVYLSRTGQITQQLDVLTMLGFVILIGTVVNNPILIVHQALNYMREDHVPTKKAILQSVRTRIRPIFMTTLTTVLGLLPLVLFPGAGSELYRGLGSVVLGGLVVSTIFTLLLVPTLFSLMLDAKVNVSSLVWGKPIPPTDQPTDNAEVAVAGIASRGEVSREAAGGDEAESDADGSEVIEMPAHQLADTK